MNMTYSWHVHYDMMVKKAKGVLKVTNELLKKAEELMKKCEVASLSSIDETGYPRTAAMCSLKTEGINTVWFSTGTISNKVNNYKRNPKAGVCFSIDGNNVTLMGNMTIVEDMNIKTELWVDWFIKHFPLGVTDPNYCVLKFESNYIQAYIDDEFEELYLD